MTDPMKDLLDKIEATIKNLKIGINSKDRDMLEFDINDLNINIGGLEYDYDIKCINLEKEKDTEYQIEKENIKTDAGMKRHLESKFLDKQLSLDSVEAQIKYYKRLHNGYIRVAEHVKSNVIKEQADMKRNGF